ncbi:MAG: CPBP family intramembrane glutamic endopeptidase, partial [Tumebacillaceae bacterium]
HRNQTLVMQIDHATGQLMSYEQTDQRFPSVVRESIARSMATVALQQVGVEAAKMQVSGGEEQTVLPAGSGAVGGRKPVLNHQRTYVFQDPAWKVGQLTLKYEVTITGNQVASVKPVYVLPNDYTAWHDRQKLVGTVLTGLCALFSFVLFVLGFVFLFLVKEKKRYGAALWLTLAIFVTYLVSNLNQLPVIQMEMLSKGIGGLTFLISNAVMVIVLAVISFVVAGGTFPMILTGGMLAQQLNPRFWSSWRDPDWKVRIRRAMWRGCLLAITWLGFQNLFYFGAEHFGVFFENDMSMSPVNSLVPALFPLAGWLAGIQEEVVYRLFGINFFKRYWKNTFVATLIPAMIWALGHSLYPIFPTYTRLIELTLFGVMFGYCYLWFGIETTIFAHVVFDVAQMCIPLLLSGVTSQVTAGFIFIISPILVAYGLSFLQPNREKVMQVDNIV